MGAPARHLRSGTAARCTASARRASCTPSGWCCRRIRLHMRIFFSMTKTKPCCSKCKMNEWVKTIGGGTHAMYRYLCEDCEYVWQQIPPHRQDASDPNTLVVVEPKVNTRRPINYKCTKCGKPKRGHVCNDKPAQEDTSFAQTTPFPVVDVLTFGGVTNLPTPFADFEDMPPLTSTSKKARTS